MMFIRTASERDLVAISALLEETWHATYDAIYGAERVTEITNKWHSVPSLRGRLTRPNSEFLVADDGKQIAGMAFAAADENGRTVTLFQLYVRPASQRHGVGGLLLEEVMGCFPDAESIRLEVEPANARAIAFYRSFGFAEAQGAERPAGSKFVLERPLGLAGQ